LAFLFDNLAELNSSEQDEDQQNDEDDPDQSGRTITPTGAMWPSRNDAQKYKDEYDDQNGAE